MHDIEITPEMAMQFITAHKQVFLIMGALLVLLPIYSSVKRFRGKMRRYARRKATKYILPGLVSILLPYVTEYLSTAGLPADKMEYVAPVLFFIIAAAFYLFF